MLSSNVEYIGLDVHKEAVAIAVLNGAVGDGIDRFAISTIAHQRLRRAAFDSQN